MLAYGKLAHSFSCVSLGPKFIKLIKQVRLGSIQKKIGRKKAKTPQVICRRSKWERNYYRAS